MQRTGRGAARSLHILCLPIYIGDNAGIVIVEILAALFQIAAAGKAKNDPLAAKIRAGQRRLLLCQRAAQRGIHDGRYRSSRLAGRSASRTTCFIVGKHRNAQAQRRDKRQQQ